MIFRVYLSMAIWTGFLLGLGTLLFIGPVLFYLLKSAMESGFKAGVSVALGIVVGDFICALLALYGAQSFLNNARFEFWAAIIGGLILFGIGLKYVLNPNLDTTVKAKIKRKSYGVYFLNGFLINFVNPFVFAVWIGFVSYNQSLYDTASTLLSIGVTLVVIFATDLLKAMFADKLTALIHPSALKKVFRVFGVFMVIFGIRLMLQPFI